MSTKSDWQAVHQKVTAEERRAIDDPPTAEEMLAYARGELHGADAERVRVWLVGNPDAARALTEPFPTDDAKPGDPDFLSQDELAKHWNSLQTRIHGSKPVEARPEGRVVPFRQRWTAVAAAFAITFAGLYWQAEVTTRRLTAKLNEPRVLAKQHLLPDGNRGAEESTLLHMDGERVLLEMFVPEEPAYARYLIGLTEVSTNPPRKLWSTTTGVDEDRLLSIQVPRANLTSGKYRITVSGPNGGPEQQVSSFTFRVP